MTRHGTNYGYIPRPADQAALAERCARLYGADVHALPFDPDASVVLVRALVNVLRGGPRSQWLTKAGSYWRLVGRNQSSFGSCVGHGEAGKLETTLAAGVYLRGERYQWPTDAAGRRARISPSWCYGASREHGGNLGRYQGSNGSWAARCSADWGFLFERNYEGAVDLSNYSTRDCDVWDTRGVPAASKPLAAQQKFSESIRVEDVDTAARLLQNGYAINTCTRRRYSTERDEYGRSRYAGWTAHSEFCSGRVVYRVGGRSMVLFQIDNSHGDTRYRGGTGSKTPDLPGASYMIDEGEFQKRLDDGDSWASWGPSGLREKARHTPHVQTVRA